MQLVPTSLDTHLHPKRSLEEALALLDACDAACEPTLTKPKPKPKPKLKLRRKPSTAQVVRGEAAVQVLDRELARLPYSGHEHQPKQGYLGPELERADHEKLAKAKRILAQEDLATHAMLDTKKRGHTWGVTTQATRGSFLLAILRNQTVLMLTDQEITELFRAEFPHNCNKAGKYRLDREYLRRARWKYNRGLLPGQGSKPEVWVHAYDSGGNWKSHAKDNQR